MKLHRIHAAPASGKGGNSFDLGPYRWRPENASPGKADQARAMAHRLSTCWNVLEGIPTEALEDGVLRREAEAVQELLDAATAGHQLQPYVDRLRAAHEAVGAIIDFTNGRIHDCEQCLRRGK